MSARTGHQTVDVGVEAPGPLDEWEVSWYRERLYDRALLDASLVIVIGRSRYLAVPTGGRRRGGWISVDDRSVLDHLVSALQGREGFPLVWVRWSGHPDVCHAVAWGEPHPRTTDQDEVLRFYGLDPAAAKRACDEEFADV